MNSNRVNGVGARPVLLVTGGGGSVAGHLLSSLARDWSLRLVDRRDTAVLERARAAGHEVMIGDLTDPAVTQQGVADAEAILHLAGNGDPTANWQQLLAPNVVAWSRVLEAAEHHRVSQLVFASSVHASGGDFGPNGAIDPGHAAHPCCAYGATKVYGEALGHAAHQRSGLSVTALRLGAVIERPRTHNGHHYWVHPDDLAALTRRALSTHGFGIHHAVSMAGAGHWSIDSAREVLDYRPALRAVPPTDGESAARVTGPPHGVTPAVGPSTPEPTRTSIA